MQTFFSSFPPYNQIRHLLTYARLEVFRPQVEVYSIFFSRHSQRTSTYATCTLKKHPMIIGVLNKGIFRFSLKTDILVLYNVLIL